MNAFTTIFGADSPVNPDTAVDWGVLGLILFGLVTSVTQGSKKVIDWVVSKITTPDTRLAELEAAKAVREAEDRARIMHLEEAVENLRAELLSMHQELKQSEVARAKVEGELTALRAQINQNSSDLSRSTPSVTIQTATPEKDQTDD